MTRQPIDEQARNVRTDWAWGAALLATHAVLAWICRAPGILTRQDDTRYLMLARALARGSYRDLWWVDTPMHHLYPPGYPAVLAGWTAVAGESFTSLVVLQIALSIAALGLLFDGARRRLASPVAICSLALAAINPSLIEWSGQVASEPALMLCIALLVWASVVLDGRRQLLVMIVAAALAPCMRSAGVVFPVGVVLFFAAQRRWRYAATSAALLAPVVATLLWWTLHDPNPVVGSSYAADLAASIGGERNFVLTLLLRLRANAVYYFTQGVPYILPLPTVPGTIVDNLLDVSLMAVLMVMGLRASLRPIPLLGGSVALTFALLAIWTWQSERFVVPILPLLHVLLVSGAWHSFAARSPATRRTVMAIACGVIALTSAKQLGVLAPERVACVRGEFPDPACVTVDQASFFAAVRFVGDSTAPGARVISTKSEPLSYRTSRTTMPYQLLRELNGADLRHFATSRRVEYVLLSPLHYLDATRLLPALRDRCHDLQVVRAFPPRTLLLRWASTDRRPVSDACEALRTIPIKAAEDSHTDAGL